MASTYFYMQGANYNGKLHAYTLRTPPINSAGKHLRSLYSRGRAVGQASECIRLSST